MNKKIIFAALFLLASLASATFIRMSTNIYAEPIIQASSTVINISLINSGDEPAHDAQVSLILPEGMASNGVYLGVMYPNVQYGAVFNVTVSEGKRPGRYPIVMKLHYTDANAYPFSVVSPSFMMYKEATPVMVRGLIPETTLGISEEKELKIRLSNMDVKPHNLLVHMVSSDEISMQSPEREVYVNANSEEDVSFRVKSFGALPESSYVVFATIEYDDEYHYSSVATGVVKVVSGGQGMGLSWLPLAILLILILLFLVITFRHGGSRWLLRKRVKSKGRRQGS